MLLSYIQTGPWTLGTWAIEPQGQGVNSRACRDRGFTVMARKQKTSTPVYVPICACLYLCKVDTVVFPLGKTEIALR